MRLKRAYSERDKANIIKALVGTYNLPYEIGYTEAADLWSFVIANSKRRFTPPSSAMDSNDWTDFLDSRFALYLKGYNFQRPTDASQIITWENDEVVQNDVIAGSVQNTTSLSDLRSNLLKFMVSRTGDLQRSYSAQKAVERSDSEIGLDEKGKGVTEREYKAPSRKQKNNPSMGGRETGKEFPFEKWQEYSSLASSNPLVGQAVNDIQEVWEELIEDYLADVVVTKSWNKQSQHSLAEEKVIFYGGYQINTQVQGTTVKPENMGVGVGKNPFKDQQAIAWYLLFRGARSWGIKHPSQIGWKRGKKIEILTLTKVYQQYKTVIDLAFKPNGTGLSWDQTKVPSQYIKDMAKDMADPNKGYTSAKDIRPLTQLISKRLAQGGTYEKVIFESTEIQFTFDENLSYEDWLPAPFKKNFPALTAKFVKAFQKLDIGLAAYAQQRRFAKKHQNLVTRVAYKYILQNGGKETHIERIASLYMEKKANR